MTFKSSAPFAQWALPLGLVGSLVGILGDSYHVWWEFAGPERSALLSSPLYRVHGLAIGAGYGLALAALAALLTQKIPSGRMERIGATLAFIATPLVIGDYWAESVVVPGVIAQEPALADTDASGLHLLLVIAAFAVFAVAWILVMLAQRRRSKMVAIGGTIAAVVAFTPFSGSNILLFLAIGALCLHRRAGAAPVSTALGTAPAPPTAPGVPRVEVRGVRK